MQRRCSTSTSGTPLAARNFAWEWQKALLNANDLFWPTSDAWYLARPRFPSTCSCYKVVYDLPTYLYLPAPTCTPVQLSCLCPVERGNAIFTHACAEPRQVQKGEATRHVKWEYYSFYFSDRAAYVTGEAKGKGSNYRKSSLKQFRVIITAKWKTIKNYKAKAKLA